MPQTDSFTGERLERWHVWTTTGRKTTWSPTPEGARKKAERKGLAVERVTAAPDPLADR